VKSDQIHTESVIDNVYCLLREDLIDVPEWRRWFTPRGYTGPGIFDASPAWFKRITQVRDFYKRITLISDPTHDELSATCLSDFKTAQSGFGIAEPESEITKRVLREAARLIKDVLGSYDIGEHAALCTWGKRAAFGLTAATSYLENRVKKLTYSGEQLEYFLVMASCDPQLLYSVQDALTKGNLVETSHLGLSTVPKSYKAVRVIGPDTILGGFISKGLGKLVQLRLAQNAHIDIRHAQDRHKDLARKGSIDGSLCTLDMSKASDSFTWEHIKALMPPDWLHVLSVVRTDAVLVPGEDVPMPLTSYMLMGSGHTFPLQTLLFWSMVQAVVNLMGEKRSKVYVYGDDIIATSKYASQICVSLQKLGFTLNADKSFVDGSFRESCGGDYHTGVDVRPHLPEHVTRLATTTEVLALIHSLANGLTERWATSDIPKTYAYLIELASSLDSEKCICKVEADAPDYAGFRLVSFHDYGRIAVRYSSALQRAEFRSLKMRSQKRRISNGAAYYWRWLHGSSLVEILIGDPYDPDATTQGGFGEEGKKGCGHRYRWAWA